MFHFNNKKSRYRVWTFVLALSLLFGSPTNIAGAKNRPSLNHSKLTITVGKKATLKLKHTQKKVKWKITSGKKIVKITPKSKNSIQIKGQKAGKAVIKAKVGGTSYICRIIVKKKPASGNQDANTTPTPTPAPNNDSGSGNGSDTGNDNNNFNTGDNSNTGTGGNNNPNTGSDSNTGNNNNNSNTSGGSNTGNDNNNNNNSNTGNDNNNNNSGGGSNTGNDNNDNNNSNTGDDSNTGNNNNDNNNSGGDSNTGNNNNDNNNSGGDSNTGNDNNDNNTDTGNDSGDNNDNNSDTTTTGLALTVGSYSISLGESLSSVKGKLGEPIRIDAMPQGYDGYVYNPGGNYSSYMIIGIKNNAVVTCFTLAKGFSVENYVSEGVLASSLVADGWKLYTWPTYKYIYRLNTEDGNMMAFCDHNVKNQVFAVMLHTTDYTISKLTSCSSCTYNDAIMTAAEKQIREVTNAFRVYQGLSTLSAESKATTVARGHSQDMATNNFFDHISQTTGYDPYDRMDNAGIPWKGAAENIIAGYSDGISMTLGWIASEGHRKNMLGNYTYLGCGVAYNYSSRYQLYGTQNFWR